MTTQLVGVISDTHGLMRPEALEALRGVELILHAGDIGKPAILESLNQIAPVIAIRGNNDRDPWAATLPDTRTIQLGQISIYLIHNRKELDLDPVVAGIQAVIAGHSHQPLVEWNQGVLYLNPGSAGPRRFKLPISVALVSIEDSFLKPEIIELKV